MMILSRQIVAIVYGDNYSQSSEILKILTWYTTFSYYGAAKDVWILAEEKQRYLVCVNGTGAILNVLLNYILIPKMGAQGAALASLLTQFTANIVMGFIIKPLRPNNFLLIAALNPMEIVASVIRAMKRKESGH